MLGVLTRPYNEDHSIFGFVLGPLILETPIRGYILGAGRWLAISELSKSVPQLLQYH